MSGSVYVLIRTMSGHGQGADPFR